MCRRGARRSLTRVRRSAKGSPAGAECQVPGAECQVPSAECGYQVSGIRYQVSGTKFFLLCFRFPWLFPSVLPCFRVSVAISFRALVQVDPAVVIDHRRRRVSNEQTMQRLRVTHGRSGQNSDDEDELAHAAEYAAGCARRQARGYLTAIMRLESIEHDCP